MTGHDQEPSVSRRRQAPSTLLPNAVIDDDQLTTAAKLAYWHLVRANGRMRLDALAGFLRVSPAQASLAISELIALDWITPLQADENGPRVAVHLTPSAVAR